MLNAACNDREHVVILQKVDRMILAAEAAGVEKGLRTRMHALRNLIVVHAENGRGLTEEIQNAVKTHKKRILIGGLCATLAIAAPYFVISRTHWLRGRPLACQIFPTKDAALPGRIEVCINGVTRPYTPLNGDMELDFTYQKTPALWQQVDATFWLADELGEKKVDYSGEYNIQRVRTYNRAGLLVTDSTDAVSSWERPLVPEDVRLPLWQWVHRQRDALFYAKPPLGETISNWIAGFWPVLATIGSMAVTAYRFLKAG
jgi:hypothetical protein